MENSHKLASSNHKDPIKYYSNFLYKAIIVSVFLAILPILPSQAPEFVNKNRSWELFQLLFVGVAVSYGLFSRKQEETEEHGANSDTTHTYLSQFLQISSVFDEEGDSLSVPDESKVQTWSNQYYREEPALVVEQKKPVFEKQSRLSSVSNEKRLLLPVRSLKSRVSEHEKLIESGDIIETFTRSKSYSGSNSGSKRISSESKIDGNGEFKSTDFGVKSEENVVLRSPIPWRSRSGRMEMREDSEFVPQFSLDSETEYSVSEPIESPNSVPLKPNSRNKFSEPELKNADDLARKNTYYNTKTPPAAPPPPPPPPPPPHHLRKPPLGKSGFVPVKEPIKQREIEEVENSGVESEEEIVSNGDGDGDLGPDVNKKADEFIAKFREQIRLQRIESIKKIGRNSSR